ncbi:DUF3617 domain-containing protein [Sphingomonas soli]|uniref:DUF3617 domain-containing protein n=1 Tax=Sphingomonas soli TaxID=266127 RepID=UPI000B07CA3E|nr:hypothetical protein [Sphingomonas soli]
MSVRRMMRPAIAGGLLLFGGGGASAQRSDQMVVVRAIQPGQWVLKELEGSARKLCLTEPAKLLQIQHGAAQCQHVLMDNGPRSATIRYTCAGRGNGRTTITLETPRLITIDTQGVLDGAPFSDQYEGRWAGNC